MRVIHLPMAVLLIGVLPYGGTAVHAADPSDDQCEAKAVNTIEEGMCALARRDAADKEMNGLYTKLMQHEVSKPVQERLRDAQRAWLVFRDRSCLYEVGKPEESGTSYAQSLLDCETAHTKRRTDDLHYYLCLLDADEPFKCHRPVPP